MVGFSAGCVALELSMTKTVLTTCCAALIAGCIPSGAQVFGDLYWKMRSSAPGLLSEPTLARWMMTLPVDEASAQTGTVALLEGRSVGADPDAKGAAAPVPG